MSSLSLRLPDSLHAKVRELAERDDVSINQFIATAVAEKAAALLTVDYLEERAARADRGILRKLLDRVPRVAPSAGDELPSTYRPPGKAPQSASRARPQRRARKSSGAASD
jgi:predicted transcriptional regulator